MNPVEWKREHQVALAVAVVIGLWLGLIFGFAHNADRGERFFAWLSYTLDSNHPASGMGAGWSIVGGLIAAGLVYVTVLLRK